MAQKLLLADDSVTIQRVIELTFADENIEVVAVSDGDQAIARIDADPPDIVLADIGMPGRDGYEVAAHVKSEPRLAHIPVVLLTGAFEPVDQARAAQVGSDGVLAKPFEPQLVIARVRELLAQPAAARPAAPPLDANLSNQPPAPPAAKPAVPDVDWFSTAPPATAKPSELPLSYASPAPSGAAEPGATQPSQAPATFAGPPLPVVPASAVPTLGDAFAAILAAEQADPSAAAVAWPSAPAAPIGEEVVEEITRRVLERLSDRVVREPANRTWNSRT